MLFFVSVGMLLDPAVLMEQIEPVLALTALVVFGKFFVAGPWVLPFPRPARMALVVAAGSCQIGEFSFILDQAGLDLGLLNKGQHSLILATALLSILVNPFMLNTVRREHYDALVKSLGEHALLRELLDASDIIDIAWRKVQEGSALAGTALGAAALRTCTGATVVAIKRKNELMVNPGVHTVFMPGDRVGGLGNPEQLEALERLLAAP